MHRVHRWLELAHHGATGALSPAVQQKASQANAACDTLSTSRRLAAGTLCSATLAPFLWPAPLLKAAAFAAQVEDMDLSLRSYVGGWKAIFLEDTTCLNELPASFFAYRKQQHRWTCGPVQLWRKTGYYIWKSSLPLHRKVRTAHCPHPCLGSPASPHPSPRL